MTLDEIGQLYSEGRKLAAVLYRDSDEIRVLSGATAGEFLANLKELLAVRIASGMYDVTPEEPDVPEDVVNAMSGDVMRQALMDDWLCYRKAVEDGGRLRKQAEEATASVGKSLDFLMSKPSQELWAIDIVPIEMWP